MLDEAKATLEQMLAALRPVLEGGTPIIGIEPSCVSVFRDEMTNLLDKNLEAQKLKSQTYLFSEFLINQADYRPPHLKRKAIVHAHCHHKSVEFDSDPNLKRMVSTSMFSISAAAAWRVLLALKREIRCLRQDRGARAAAAVRAAAADTLIITDGFSCYQQIEGLTGRKALHIAEVLQMAISEMPNPLVNPAHYSEQLTRG